MTEELQLFAEIIQMSKSAAFADLMKIPEALVEESHQSILNCISGDANVYKTFVIRYQQSVLLKKSIENWLQSAKQGYETITEEMRRELEIMAAQGVE